MTPWLIVAQQGDGAGAMAGLMPWLPLLVMLALLVIALIDVIRNPRLTDNERLIWVIVVIFVGCLGPILYLLIGRNKTPGAGTTGGGTGP